MVLLPTRTEAQGKQGEQGEQGDPLVKPLTEALLYFYSSFSILIFKVYFSGVCVCVRMCVYECLFVNKPNQGVAPPGGS